MLPQPENWRIHTYGTEDVSYLGKFDNVRMYSTPEQTRAARSESKIYLRFLQYQPLDR